MSGYDTKFTPSTDRTGRKALLLPVNKAAPAIVRKAREAPLGVRGVKFFNILPASLRNSDHGDIDMFKNHLDIYLQNIPDEPTVAGLVRGAETNSLLHQVPIYEVNNFQ